MLSISPDTATFLHRLLNALSSNGDSVAVIDQDGHRQTTYKELFALACQVVGYLQGKQYPAHSFVGICLPSSMEYVAAELGVWMAGHAIVPMGDSFPPYRIDYIMNHCGSPLLIDQDTFKEIVATAPSKTWNLPVEDDVMALFYTSGSTGKPKGVIHTFRTFDFSQFILNTLQEVKPLVMGMTLSMFFVVSEYMLASLSVGGKIVIVPPAIIKDVRRLEDFYKEHRVTYAFFTPSLLKYFHAESSYLQVVMVASERVSNIAPNGYRLINIYGQTETGEGCFMFDIDKAYDNTPIGKPTMDHLEYKILDDDMNEVSPGEEGELCLRGLLSPGYYKDPERTAALWRGGWLHTGDIVRQLQDGNIVYVNRKDWMLKINGQRVEPGEVETTIRQYAGIKDVIVKGFTTSDRQYLCAYYVTDGNVNSTDLRQYLSSRLPAYMIPAYFVRMNHLPLLPNGKADRHSLRPPVQQETTYEQRPPYRSPQNVVEQKLCDVFSATLKVKGIGADDDFFALGGDSIRVMEVQSLCSELALTARMVYANRTPSRIAEALSQQETTVYAKQSDYLLSQTQLGIFSECMSRQGEAVYNNGMLFRLGNGVDLGRLAKACEAVVAAHPYIKMRVLMDDEGNPRQRPSDDEAYRQDIETIDGGDFESLKHRLIQPFDLLNDRLFRIRIFKTSSDAYLFMDFHHIIFDGTSMGILIKDINDAYCGKTLEQETWNGFEVAQEEEALRLSDDYQKAAAWNRSVFGSLDISSLPESDVTSETVTYGHASSLLRITNDQLQEACRQLGVTPHMLTMAVFGYVLGSFTYARESLFATVYNGRKDFKTARTIAMMVKTLAVHTQWDRGTTLYQYLQHTKQQQLESMNNDLFSFAEMSAMNRCINSQILFAYQGDIETVDTLCGEPVEDFSLTKSQTGEVLLFELSCRHHELHLRAEYQSSRYSQLYIDEFIRCYEEVLRQFIFSDANRLVSDIPLVSDKEKNNLIQLGTGRTLEYDKNKTLVSLFRDAASKQPHATAVIYQDKRLSYQELDSLTDRLASYLIRHYHLQQEDVVGVMIDRSELLVIYPLAILKAGAAYMPLDYSFPASRLSYMCEGAGVKLILSEGRYVEESIPDFKGEVFLADDLETIPTQAVDLPLLHPDYRFVVLYTSGTTGTPKGVALEHHSVLNYCLWYSIEFSLSADDCVMANSDFGFDAHMMDIYPALIAGASVCIIPSSMRLDMPLLNQYMEEQHITVSFMTTQMGYLFVTNMANTSLRVLTVGGEKLMPLQLPPYQLYNMYGPTECTICVSYYHITHDFESPYIGRPLPNHQLCIVNADMQYVPRGVTGELIVKGEGVGRGYLRSLEANDPFVDFEGERCYRTGDIVRWSEDGNLDFLGRVDQQVKLHGLRIELEEIETRALQHPSVSQAVACVKTVGDDDCLCLYYVPKIPNASLDTDELKSFLAETLATFMVPTFIIKQERLPMSANGKISRKDLPAPLFENNASVAPETEAEKRIFELLASQLKTTRFGVTDNLTFLGLSSLAAMRLSAVLKKRFDVQVKMSDVMRHPTVRAIAALLTESSGSHLPVYEPRTYYPLMENQRGLYLEWEKNPNTTQYNIPFVYRFNGIDADRMIEALRRTVNAHPYLKSKFVSIDGKIVLQRQDEESVEIFVSEVGTEPDDAYFHQRILPFNLLGGQLYHIEVVKTPTCVYVLFDVHHIIFDGLSVDVFMNDLKCAYDGTPLSGETVQAFDYALYERDHLYEVMMSKAEKRMDILLANAQVFSCSQSLKPDGLAFGVLELSIPGQKIDNFCAAHHVTVNSYMHAAFNETIRRLSREDSLVYLTVDNGREAGAELMQSVGMFVKTLLFVSTLRDTSGLSASAYVQEIQRQLQEAYEMDCYPLTWIVERHNIYAEVMFAYQGELLEKRFFDNMEQVIVEPDIPKFPISILITPHGDEYSFLIEYDGMRYDRLQMQRLLSAVSVVAVQLATVETIGHIELVDSDTQASLLKLGTGPTLDYDQSATFVSLFRQQVGSAPDAIAVVDESGSITYRELDRQSDILAATLVELGVVADSFVCIMLPRCKEFLVGILAVFKAGGAYVPLDSDMPEDRLSFILADSQTHVLLSTRQLCSEKFSKGRVPVDNTVFIDEVGFSAEATAMDNSCPSSLAYMIYTSGSTGNPKGVMITHAAMMNFLVWLAKTEELKPGEQCAIHTSFVFDGSLFDLFPPLISGATLHILSASMRIDLQGMCRYFKDNHIVGLLLTTQVGMLMMSLYDLPLRFLMVGGEKLTGFKPSSMKLFNCYGPTEFTVCSAFHLIDNNKEYESIPIGRPVPNSVAAVVDSQGRLLPQGFAGELCMLGRQMAKGYWNHQELTDSHFTSCPFIPEETMYHTGDLVRWNDDGELEYLGRIDSQVKIRGYRIELEEIEKNIMGVAGVTSAAVVIRQERQLQYLVGYYTTTASVSADVIHNHLVNQLPEYMVPQLLIQLKTMPITLNGKIDRKKLKDENYLTDLVVSETVAPMTKDEYTLFNLACLVLETNKFGVTDDLTLWGMNSLLSIKLAELAHQSGLLVKVNDILKYKSVRNILFQDQSIGTWEGGFDSSKPVVVLVQGLTSYKNLEPLIDKLCNHYSVFAIETIGDHFNFLFNEKELTRNDVVEFYLDYLEAYLPSDANVALFMGHSFGGELAYRCAVRWRQKTKTTSKVCLLDTYSHVETIVKENWYPDIDEQTMQLLRSLVDDKSLPGYEGDVIYFKATNSHKFVKEKREDEHRWKALIPQIEIHPVAAGHFSMLDSRYCDEYVRVINNSVLPHQS